MFMLHRKTTMFTAVKRSLALTLLLTAFLHAAQKESEPPQHWVVTWASGSLPYRNPGFWQFGNPEQDRIMSTGVLENQTIRMMVPATIGGTKARIQLSNRFGDSPLHIGHAHIALLPVPLDEPEGQTIFPG
jgi:hypothetical protein